MVTCVYNLKMEYSVYTVISINFNIQPVGLVCHFKHIINEKRKITQRQEVNKDTI